MECREIRSMHPRYLGTGEAWQAPSGTCYRRGSGFANTVPDSGGSFGLAERHRAPM